MHLRSELSQLVESRHMLLEDQHQAAERLSESEKARNQMELALEQANEEALSDLEKERERFAQEIARRDWAVSQLETAVEAVSCDKKRLQKAEAAAKTALDNEKQLKQELRRSMEERDSLLGALDAIKAKTSREGDRVSELMLHQEELLIENARLTASLQGEQEKTQVLVNRMNEWGKTHLPSLHIGPMKEEDEDEVREEEIVK